MIMNAHTKAMLAQQDITPGLCNDVGRTQAHDNYIQRTKASPNSTDMIQDGSDA
jgi:hypothetical protein